MELRSKRSGFGGAVLNVKDVSYRDSRPGGYMQERYNVLDSFDRPTGWMIARRWTPAGGYCGRWTVTFHDHHGDYELTAANLPAAIRLAALVSSVPHRACQECEARHEADRVCRSTDEVFLGDA